MKPRPARTSELLSLVREPNAIDLEVEDLLSARVEPVAAPTWQEPRTARPPCDVPVLVRYGGAVATAVFTSALDAFGTTYIAGVRVVGVREPDMAQISSWMSIPGGALELPAEEAEEVEVVIAELVDEDEAYEIEAERGREEQRRWVRERERESREREAQLSLRRQLQSYAQPARPTVRVDPLGPPGPTFLTGGGWNQG